MEKDKIIEYLMNTPHNTNINILNSILDGYENKNEIIAYAMKTPYNMNRMVLEGLISDKPTGVIIYSDTIATTVKAGMSFADYDGTTETLIDSLIVSIEFNGTLYENVACETATEDDISYYSYGDSDLQDYPFYISSWEEDGDNLLYIKTETAGDYTITISTSA